ncbi:uncharacterized protein LOC101691780 [Mustela putorius furo]|uniref:Uncharacterized protein LOC101691780 n=1 Tax=Mustela putorius furo TaxID=9669 RepID=A0A8U0V3W9_MUSPF|nr:uncharacterized protein LOC101691780 [Mustela putorius furo]
MRVRVTLPPASPRGGTLHSCETIPKPGNYIEPKRAFTVETNGQGHISTSELLGLAVEGSQIHLSWREEDLARDLVPDWELEAIRQKLRVTEQALGWRTGEAHVRDSHGEGAVDHRGDVYMEFALKAQPGLRWSWTRCLLRPGHRGAALNGHRASPLLGPRGLAETARRTIPPPELPGQNVLAKRMTRALLGCSGNQKLQSAAGMRAAEALAAFLEEEEVLKSGRLDRPPQVSTGRLRT